MEDKNCELLFEYLRSILYDSKVKTLDIKELDEPYQKLGMGLQFLEHAVVEMKEYSEALSKGQLSASVPDRDNFLCANLKNLHANLNHLTWQAKQVAKGDYTQNVSFLGEFSDAFNTMTRQLRERELYLRRKAEAEKDHASQMERCNQLLMAREARLETEAYQDSLTGIGNRHFFLEKAEEALADPGRCVFCYCDLDHLKQVNDTFGHIEGDWYIRYFADTVRFHIREEDIFARIGGDEFCIILRNCTEKKARQKLKRIQSILGSEKGHSYAKGFSFGLVEIPEEHGTVSINEVLHQADLIMYEQKREHQNYNEKFLELK